MGASLTFSNGVYLSTPDGAPYQINGDLDCRFHISASSYTSVQTVFDADADIVSAFGGVQVYLASGLVACHYPLDGSANRTEGSNLGGLVDGKPVSGRMFWDVSSGDLTWYRDGAQVDTDTFSAGAGGDTAGGVWTVGGGSPSGAAPFTGTLYRFTVRDGSTVVADIDPRDVVAQLGVGDVANGATFTGGATGRTWTVNGTGLSAHAPTNVALLAPLARW